MLFWGCNLEISNNERELKMNRTNQTKELDVRAGINNIARREGTNKMDPVFYSAKAPHNQGFNKPGSKQKES